MSYKHLYKNCYILFFIKPYNFSILPGLSIFYLTCKIKLPNICNLYRYFLICNQINHLIV